MVVASRSPKIGRKMPRLCKRKSDHPFADGGWVSGNGKPNTPILILRGSFPVEVDFSFQKTVLAFVCERTKKARPTVGTGRYENSGRC